MKQQAGGEMSDREAPVVKGFGSGEGLRVKQLWFSFVGFDSQLRLCMSRGFRFPNLDPQFSGSFNHPALLFVWRKITNIPLLSYYIS